MQLFSVSAKEPTALLHQRLQRANAFLRWMSTFSVPKRMATEPLSVAASGHLKRTFGSRELRLVLAILDALQITGIGVSTACFLYGVGLVVDCRETLVLALSASALAAILRLATRATRPAGTGAIWTSGACAARANMLAVLVVGFEHRLTLSLPLPILPLTVWLLLWGSLAAATGWLLHAVSQRVSRIVAVPPHFFLFGETNHTARLADVLKAMPGTLPQRVMQIGDQDSAAIRQVVCYPAHRDDLALLVAETLDNVRIDGVCHQLADFPGKVCLAIRAPSVGPLPQTLPRWGDYLLIDIVADPHGGIRGVVKRLIDVLGASILIVLLAPLMLAIGGLIRLETPGPVLFRQQRFGIGSRSIEVLKFRTMYTPDTDASGAQATVTRDPRVTKFGRVLRRLSIDELPQLFNVLRGEMALVGPRPHPLHMRVAGSYYHDVIATYRGRHRVKPGITGWAQVNGSRGAVDTLEKAQRRIVLDLWYLNHWSLSLDFRILLRTMLGGFASLSAD